MTLPCAPCKSPYSRGKRQQAIARSRADLPGGSDMVANILGVYAQATAEEVQAGEAWYWSANVESERATEAHANGPAIVAALSPQSSWGQNIVNTFLLCSGELPTTQSEDNLRKAIAILGGADPTDILGGRKVRNFWRNISTPDRIGPVTIDRHAMAIAILGPGIWSDSVRLKCAGRKLERIGSYQIVAGAYRTAARRVHLRPQELQAIVWLTWRRTQEIAWASHDPF